MATKPRVLAVDVGGSHVKLLLQGEVEPRKVESGPTMTPREMVEKVVATSEGWSWDVASIGIPMPVRHDRPVLEPANLGKGWVDFDFGRALGRPTKVVNDAVMQALGSYDGGRMLFIGLGTGLGSALVTDGIAQPLELAHLPFRDSTFEDYVGERSLELRGKKKWRKLVFEVVELLANAMQSDYVVIGGGGVKELDELPPNADAATTSWRSSAAFASGTATRRRQRSLRNSALEARGNALRQRLLEQLQPPRALPSRRPARGPGGSRRRRATRSRPGSGAAPARGNSGRARASRRTDRRAPGSRSRPAGRQATGTCGRESTTRGSGCAGRDAVWIRSA